MFITKEKFHENKRSLMQVKLPVKPLTPECPAVFPIIR